MSVSSVIRQGLGSTPSDLVRLGLGSGSPPPAAVGPIITLGLKYTPSDIIRMGLGASASGAPTAPSGVTGTPTSGTTATIAWTDNSADETGFDVEIAPVSTGTYAAASGATNPTAANVVSFAATGLTDNTEYTARVRAKGASADSAYATSASFWTDNTGGGGGVEAHDAISAVLAGSGAVTAGVAARSRVHASSGVLAGAGAAVSGAAEIELPAGTHSTAGTLVGPGASVAGTATVLHVHAATGVLAGAGAAVSGVAYIRVTHAASGVLAGAGAVVSATCVRSGSDADETYPLAGLAQDYPLTTAQDYPLAGQITT